MSRIFKNAGAEVLTVIVISRHRRKKRQNKVQRQVYEILSESVLIDGFSGERSSVDRFPFFEQEDIDLTRDIYGGSGLSMPDIPEKRTKEYYQEVAVKEASKILELKI